MTTTAPAQTAENANPQDAVVLPALRPDLLITQHKFEGRTYYIIKDPISLQYFRLTAEDYFLATLFDGKRTMGEMTRVYLERYPHVLLEETRDEIRDRMAKFATDLAMLQFLRVEGVRMKSRYDAQKKVKQKKPFLYDFANKIFFARFSVWDPDVVFGKMVKPLWWIWTPTTFWISVALILAAACVAFSKWDMLSAHIAGIFTLQNVALLFVTHIVVKSIHELGHGLTCKRFGGEVHEVGMMLLVFSPYFFVNVTDSWVMPKRRHRILISAAGIYVELIIAAFATFAWAVVQPGFLQQFLYNVMLICSVSTIFFNANPLMKFDGYYIATDLLEVPNLQTKSRAMISMAVKRLMFGKNYTDNSLARLPLPRKRLWLFYTYAVLSWIYGYYVIYKLAAFMEPHLAPFGLEGLANWFSALALTSWVAIPLYSFFSGMNLTLEDWKPGGRLRRMGFLFGGLVLCFGLLCFYPKELTIRRSIAIELADPDSIRASVPGFVRDVYVKEGDILKPGDPVAKLENRDVELTLAERENQEKMSELELQAALGKDRPSDAREVETIRVQNHARTLQAKAELEQLTLRTRTGGTVLSPDLAVRKGQLLRTGELFCEVAPLAKLRIKVPLSEQQVRYVEKGQEVELRSAAYPGRTIHGRIVEKPILAIDKDLPPTLSKERSGDVPTGMDREGNEIPLAQTYEAVVEIDNPDGVVRPGMTGKANIHAGRHSWGALLLHSILNLISLDLRF